MNAKKIAERLRRLAKYEIPSQPFTSRQLNGILTDIADELDPPEPKPLLADAKVGDLCQRMDGKWVQVDSYSNDRPCPVMCKSDIGGQDCFTLDGRNHNAINDSKDIIHTEPLAEVGSAEWAWQMLKIGRMVTDAPTLHHYEHNIKTSMVTCVTNRRGFRHSARSIDTWCEGGRRETGWQLYEEPPKEPEKESPVDPIERPLRSLILRAEEEGKNIRTYYQDMVFTPCALDGLLADGKFRWWNISNWELTNREQNYYPQLYEIDEPNPESAFKVGDWVEYNGKQYRISAIGGKGLFDDDKLIMFEGVIWGVSEKAELRKLDPSEVIVKIGCLKGTVERHDGNPQYWFKLRSSEYNYALISIDMLDTPTRELVESLLMAQEEK